MQKRAALYFFPVAAAIATITWLIDDMDQSNRLDALLDQQKLQINQQIDTVHQTIESITSDVIILSHDNDVEATEQINSNHKPGDTRNLTREITHFHKNKPIYHSIHLFDASGRERVHTRIINGLAQPVPPGNKPSEISSLIFQDIISLKPSHIHMSEIFPNRLEGDKNDPDEPLIRFSLPLNGSSHERFGVLALDFHAIKLINNLMRPLQLNPYTQFMLLNPDGYWLYHDRPDYRFGHLSQNSFRPKFQQYFAAPWKIIKHEYSGQFISQSGLFTYSRVRPLASIKHRLGGDIPTELLFDVLPNDYEWTIINYIATEQLPSLLHPNRLLYTGIALFIILSWLSISYTLAREQHDIEAAHNRLKRQEEQTRNIMDTTFNGIITIDASGTIRSFNAAACRIFHYEADEVIGNNVSMLMSEPNKSIHNDYLKRYIQTGDAQILQKPREVVALHKDGSSFPVELCVNARQFDEEWLFVGVLHDITRRKEMEESLKALATTDGLTGLYNRAYFNQKLQSEFKRAQRYNLDLSLIIIDADNFKSVNDDHGHPAGDLLLKTLARQASANARETDTVARYGGEEFVIILPETSGRAATQLAERLRSSIEILKVNYEGKDIARTISAGVSCIDHKSCKEADDLLILADRALYRAKELGRNRVEISRHTEKA